jgi:hypothetical protein
MAEPTYPTPDVPRQARPVNNSERGQRNALIGLSVGSALVLLIGVIAVMLTRPDDTSAIPATSPVVPPRPQRRHCRNQRRHCRFWSRPLPTLVPISL